MNTENIIKGVSLIAENPWIIAVFVAALLIIFFIILTTGSGTFVARFSKAPIDKSGTPWQPLA